MDGDEDPKWKVFDPTRIPPLGYRPARELRPVLACLRCAALTEDTEAHNAWHGWLAEMLGVPEWPAG